MQKKIFIIFLFLLGFFSCSSQKSNNVEKKTNEDNLKDVVEKPISPSTFNLNQVLIFNDNSGSFSIKRSMKNDKGKLLFQRMIYQDDFSKYLERTRSVTMFKANESEDQRLRPLISQYKGWFDGMEYSNQIKISYAKRQVEVLTDAKNGKYPVSQKFSLPPENKKLCFFHMVPECLKLWGIPQKIELNKNFETWFYVILDAFPFLEMQYEGIPNKWITEATLVYDGFKDKEHQFSLEIHEQAISLKFNEKWDFLALFWVSQGVNMVTN